MMQINKVAGDFLLFLYYKQSNDGYIDKKGLCFHIDSDKKIRIVNGSPLNEPLMKIADNNVALVCNATQYLADEKLIHFIKENTHWRHIHYQKIEISSKGINLIEGIEKGRQERKNFNMIFNIKLADNMNIESLLKAELGSIIKASVL